MKKTSFSFIELIIALTLVTLVIGSFSVSLSSLIRKNQFERESEKLQGHLQLAYDLILNEDIDLEIIFYYQEKKLICELFCEDPKLLKSVKKIKIFNHLKQIALVDKKGFLKRSIENSSLSDQKIKLPFSYFGTFEHPDYLVLTGSSQQSASFLIKGFPHVLQKEKDLLPAS